MTAPATPFDKLPALHIYVGDIKKEIGFQLLDHEEKGIWFDILLLMHASEDRGKLVVGGAAFTEKILSKSLGLTHEKLSLALKKFLDFKLFFKTPDPEGIIFCDWLVEQERVRRSRKNGGTLGGNPNFEKGKRNPYYPKKDNLPNNLQHNLPDIQQDNLRLSQKDNLPHNHQDNLPDNLRHKQKITPSLSLSVSEVKQPNNNPGIDNHDDNLDPAPKDNPPHNLGYPDPGGTQEPPPEEEKSEESFAEIKNPEVKTTIRELCAEFHVKLDFLRQRKDKDNWLRIISDLCRYDFELLKAERAKIMQREPAKGSTYYLAGVRRRLLVSDHEKLKNAPVIPEIRMLVEQVIAGKKPDA